MDSINSYLNITSRNLLPAYISNEEVSLPPEGVLFPEYYNTIMSWKTPLYAIVAYVLIVKSWNSTIKSEKISRVIAKSSGTNITTRASPLFTTFIFLHNVALCVYSAWTFYSTVIPFYQSFRDQPFWDAFCDSSHDLWNDIMGLYGYYFYLSKYYEFVDTLIILLKGRKSSILQTYHHAGAILTMYLAVNYKSYVIWVFVIFNSFIHTIMYFYYSLTTIGISPPGKQYLTRMQITQFMAGMAIGLYYLLFSNGPDRGGECFTKPGARLAIWTTIVYAIPLTWLFVSFAKRIYGRTAQKVAEKKE